MRDPETYLGPNHLWKENDSISHKQLDVLYTKEFLYFFKRIYLKY